MFRAPLIIFKVLIGFAKAFDVPGRGHMRRPTVGLDAGLARDRPDHITHHIKSINTLHHVLDVALKVKVSAHPPCMQKRPLAGVYLHTGAYAPAKDIIAAVEEIVHLS